MNKRRGLISFLAVMATLLVSSSVFGAGKADNSSTPDPYGIGVTPAVYLINFLLMYITNPNEAANMPAYRAPIPLNLSDCLYAHPTEPDLCPYSDYALSFDEDPFIGSANQTKKCSFPPDCQTDPKWEELAPPVAQHPDQINEPLGLERANSIAKSLKIDKSMILTDAEWECTIGQPPRDTEQELIVSCLNNLTNSNGNTNIPLSSYGLALDNDGNVQSLCAPHAPCLEFNLLFYGPLEKLAKQCGWFDKFQNMTATTPWSDLLNDGGNCQQNVGGTHRGGACLAAPVCD